jgi:hypothetical protein
MILFVLTKLSLTDPTKELQIYNYLANNTNSGKIRENIIKSTLVENIECYKEINECENAPYYYGYTPDNFKIPHPLDYTFNTDNLILIEDHTSYRFAYTLEEHKIDIDGEGVEHIVFVH